MGFLVTSARQFLLLVLCMGAGLVHAGEGDTFRPLASYTYGYDSNLFRQSEEYANFASGGIESETYNRLGVGFNLDWKQGRQRVLGKVQYNKTKFDRYSILDYTGQDLNLDWQWQLGNYWSGTLGGSQTKTLGSFRDVTGLVANTRTNENLHLNADYRFHSRWRANFRITSDSASYSAVAQKASNWQADTVRAGMYYQGHTIDRIGMELHSTDGSFPDRVLPTASATAYQERGFDFLANWIATGKSRLNARLGYIQRDNNNSAKDYTGLDWRLDGTWSPTGKSLMGLSLYRNINNSEVAGSNHSLIDGASLNWQWQVLPKTRLQASVMRENIDYDGITRQDKITTTSLSAIYQAWTGGEISLGIQRETRDTDATTFITAFPFTYGPFPLNYISNSLYLNANLLF